MDLGPSTSAIRVIQDPPLAGAVNMARDEALLEQVGQGASPPTMRFYQWDPPTISLGYFQRYADYEALPPPAGALAVVRRPTGGGAILHDRELTYSITLPLSHPMLAGGPNRLYELAHQALLEALGERAVPAGWSGFTDDSGAAKGPFFCFARRHKYDVLIGPEKVAGSAQRRTKAAVLQHGSIVLERRFAQQPAAAIRMLAPMSPAELAERMSRCLSRAAGVDIAAGGWRENELALAEKLLAKHSGEEWLRRA